MFFKFYVPLPILISIMTYSLCFACNVLVRKTARAWLIGMLMACFLLVLPFMLPLDYKDFVSDVMIWSWGLYLAIMLATPAAAFVFALYAAKHDWHLKTNLKGLLWVGAGLVFALMMLFSNQVANIKVLQEKEIESSRGLEDPSIENDGGKLIIRGGHHVYGRSYIDINKNKISLSDISGEPDYRIANITPRMEGYYVRKYPGDEMLYKNVGNAVYSLTIHVYCRNEGRGPSLKRFYEKAYLRSYKHDGNNRMPVCELDISDCLTDKIDILLRVEMRLIDNRLIACINNSCVVVDATDPGELKLIDKKLDVLKKIRPFTNKNRKEEFAIPLIPIEGIGLEERIRLSIDLNYRYYDYRNEINDSSIVDIHEGKFAFCFLAHEEVSRYDVTRWDDEKIYCRFSALRPYTILEVMTASPHYNYHTFTKNGKLYSNLNNTLMVFDIRSNRRIRKLGHFVRMDYNIEDMEVLEDGNILLCVRWVPEDFGINRLNVEKYYLYLLKNPE